MAEKKTTEKDGYDPFTDRDTSDTTTNFETFAHLVKGALGTGVFSMPIAFMYSGIIVGVLATFATAIICTHCVYLLVKCAHALYYRTHRSTLTYNEVTTIAFETGPDWCRGFATNSGKLVDIFLFITYFGSCAVYVVIVAKNIQAVLPIDIEVRIIIAILFLPLLLLCYIPNLKLLVPVSLVANFLMFSCIGLVILHCMQDLPPLEERDYFHLWTLPQFFAICIFAMEAIGVIMPLENKMSSPRSFFGVLYLSMFVVSIMYLIIGILGYWKFGDNTAESITLNLPADEIIAKLVKISISAAVYCSYGLQFMVVLSLVGTPLTKCFPNSPKIENYICRTIIVFCNVLLAIAVPSIAPFMGLIGSLTFASLGLLWPAILELVVFSKDGFGFCYWILFKNIFIMMFSIFASIFGTIAAIKDIAKIYGN